jgi:NAD(P)-dependent dehydrogenase (short-subunit alcohol dehydrogenase family)
VGRRGRAYWGAYSASKFAIEGLMQVLADELDENSRVRVNSINPGRVRTAMRAAAYPAENPAELLTPQDIVLPYLYLLGPDSRDVHGRALDAQ